MIKSPCTDCPNKDMDKEVCQPHCDRLEKVQKADAFEIKHMYDTDTMDEHYSKYTPTPLFSSSLYQKKEICYLVGKTLFGQPHEIFLHSYSVQDYEDR